MNVAILVLAVVTAHLSALGRAWWGPLAPEPMVPLVALLALQTGRSQRLLGALLVGGLRALVLLEPVGGQVLAVLIALSLVAALRQALGPRALLRASLLVALAWWLAASALGLVAAVAPSAGLPLLLGALLPLPPVLLMRWRARRRALCMT